MGKSMVEQLQLFTMVNDHGMEITCLDYGCIITKIVASDRNGHFENIVLGFDSIEEYQKYSPYLVAMLQSLEDLLDGSKMQNSISMVKFIQLAKEQ